jgi:hypothetical protein
MKKKINLNAYMSSLQIILELLYKKGYAQGRKDALKEFEKGMEQKGE